MFNSDKPIENFDQDILGRKIFSMQLAKSMLEFDSTDNFTIGLYGKWGCGKTSIINLALKEFSELTGQMDKEKIPIIIQFSPWNFSSAEQLISQFFKHLRNSLKTKERNKTMQMIGEALLEYSSAFEYAEALPVIGNYAKLFKLTSNLAGKRIKENALNSVNDILKAKTKVVEILKKQNKKIIVIIDDLDRLGNEQIRLVFQLVNSVAGFPNMIYLLAMDKEVVVRALENVQECNGEEYLEKIVQIPFEVPELESSKVYGLLFNKLDAILQTKPYIKFDKQYWSKVFINCIAPFISNIRDVNRVMNAFQFKYNLVCREVDFCDMIALTTLQVLAPTIAIWIYTNSERLTGGSDSITGITMSEKKKKEQEFLDECTKIYNKEPETMKNAISSLFPKIGRYAGSFYDYKSEDDLRREKRIAHPEKFKLYFSIDISQLGIKSEVLDESIKAMDKKQLEELIIKLNSNNNIIDYLQELRCCVDEIPYNRIELFLEILFEHCNNFEGEIVKSIVSFSANQYCEWCISKLFSRIESKNEKYKIYNKILKNADENTLQTIAVEINRIELSYARLASTSFDNSEQSIGLEQLLNLEKLYVERICDLNTKNQILNWKNFYMVAYLWEKFDDAGFHQYIEDALKTPINILKYVACQAHSWSGTNGTGWSFEGRNFSDYITNKKIIETLDELKNTIEFAELDEPTKLKLASFVLYQNNDEHLGHLGVSVNEANKLLEKWGNENLLNLP